MSKERSAHQSAGQQSSKDSGAGDDEKNDGDQLGNANSNAAEGLDPELSEESNRFLRGGEFEKQRLANEDGNDAGGDSADEFRKVHDG